MSLDDTIRRKVLFAGGKVTGVSCPDCRYESRDVEIDAYTSEEVICPECDGTILTRDQKATLRDARKF